VPRRGLNGPRAGPGIGGCDLMTGRQPDMKARALKLAGHRFFLVFDDGADNGPAADEP